MPTSLASTKYFDVEVPADVKTEEGKAMGVNALAKTIDSPTEVVANDRFPA